MRRALRLVALRVGDRSEDAPATGNEGGMHTHRACGAREPSPRSFFLVLGHRLQPTPSPFCGLVSWPLLDACSILPDLTCLRCSDPDRIVKPQNFKEALQCSDPATENKRK